MKTRQIRDFALPVHRYLGLAIGLIIAIIGLTGSLLVFHHEIEDFFVGRQFGKIEPGREVVSFATIVDSIETAYRDRPELTLYSIEIPARGDRPYRANLEAKDGKWMEVFIDPYTGKILGDRPWKGSFFGLVYRLHYELLAGRIGLRFVGIIALLWVILTLAGILLWPGWRRLVAGFKIKWNARGQRINFDIHKVIGIVVAGFLVPIAFTGFCWNFYEHSEPLIHALTFTPKLPEPTSRIIPGRTSLAIDELVQRGKQFLPEADLERIILPRSPEAPFLIRKKFPRSPNNYGLSSIYLDRYSGEVLRVKNEFTPTRAEAILNAFFPLHHGTFAGPVSRFFYVFAGLTPAILLVTGARMWWYRRAREPDRLSGRDERSKIIR